MVGLKENVIEGHRIPVGPSMRHFDTMIVDSKIEYDVLHEAKKKNEEEAEEPVLNKLPFTFITLFAFEITNDA